MLLSEIFSTDCPGCNHSARLTSPGFIFFYKIVKNYWNCVSALTLDHRLPTFRRMAAERAWRKWWSLVFLGATTRHVAAPWLDPSPRRDPPETEVCGHSPPPNSGVRGHGMRPGVGALELLHHQRHPPHPHPPPPGSHPDPECRAGFLRLRGMMKTNSIFGYAYVRAFLAENWLKNRSKYRIDIFLGQIGNILNI